MKSLSKTYFENAVRHPNPLVVEASTYTPVPDVEPKRRRPKHVLDDPDDNNYRRVPTTHTHATNTASSPAKTRPPISDVRHPDVDPYHQWRALHTALHTLKSLYYS
ncbi:jg18420 [Pararge aegeria aegeria]|uniref:Jg18420 protein n=1 Tax=Pararge aegeria aegeria TaxID=348720 RepID=A0A8S4SFQ5_9NEOP|nr:jg18420 [Pararge aegeria aegeria]